MAQSAVLEPTDKASRGEQLKRDGIIIRTWDLFKTYVMGDQVIHALIVEAHTIDQCAIIRQAKQAWLGVTGLWPRGYSTDLYKTKASGFSAETIPQDIHAIHLDTGFGKESL